MDLRSLAAPAGLFRLGVARAQDDVVDVWLAARPEALRSLARDWFARMRSCGDDVVVLMHDGCPVACIGDVPFGQVNCFTHHVNIGFFRGAELEDPAGLLKGSGRLMRHVKLRPDQPVDTPALQRLIDAAYANIRTAMEALPDASMVGTPPGETGGTQ